MRRTADMGKQARSAIACALLVTSALVPTVMAAPAMAQSAGTRQFDIPAQPLRSAILQFNRQSGIQVTAEGGLLDGRTSSAVQGSRSPAEALGSLLTGTGLSWRWLESGSVVLEPAPEASADAVQLGTLRVEGAGSGAGGSAGGSGEREDSFAMFREPRSIVTVNRKQLDRIPQTNPSDLFDGIPGVQMGNASFAGSFDPNIRGLQGHGRVKVLLDGSDSSQASRVTYGGNRTQNYVDPDFIAGISVEKGPGVESGGMGGTISMRTFDAKDIITDPNRNWGIRVRGMLGNNSGDNTIGMACQATTISTGATSWLVPNNSSAPRCLNGESTTRTSYAMAEYDTGADISATNWSGSVVGAWRLFESIELVAGYARRLSGNYRVGENGTVDTSYPTNGGFFFDATAKNRFSYWLPGDEVYGTFTDTESYMAKAKVMLGDHSLSFKFNHFENYFVQQANTSTQLSMGVINYYPPTSHARQVRYGADYEWKPVSDWFHVKANIWQADTDETLYIETYEASVTPQNIDTKTLGFGVENNSYIPLFSSILTVKIGGHYKQEETESDTEVSGVAMKQYGLFGSLALPVTDLLTLDGGIRYDHFKATLDPDVTYRYSENNSDGNVSLQGGITLQPAEPLQFFLRYSQGWRAPSARENTLNNCGGGYTTTVSNGTTYYSCVQGVVKPERSNNFEFGTNLALTDLVMDGDRLGIRLSRFDNRVKDYIYGSGTSFLPVTNLRLAHFVGYEVSVSYDGGWIFGDYNYTHTSKADFCGEFYSPVETCWATHGWGDLYSLYLPARHRHNATLGIRLFDRKLTIGGRAKLVRQTGYEYEGLDSYDVFDLFASFERGPLTFGLSAENITDRYYFEAGTGAAWANPAPGRMIRGTLTFRY